MQVKRIHEYKRQLLNILGVVYRYDNIKNMSPEERQKVTSPITTHDLNSSSFAHSIETTIVF